MIPIRIKKSLLTPNNGQIVGLPKNPRKWTQDDVDSLARSIEQTPELLEARPLLVATYGDGFVVLGGNMRFAAVSKIGRLRQVPCILLDGYPPSKLREFVMKDNSSFGSWDVDELANSWDDLPLSEWGVNVSGLSGSSYEGDNKEMDTDAWSEDMTMKFQFTSTEYDWLMDLFKDKDPRTEILNALGYGKD